VGSNRRHHPLTHWTETHPGSSSKTALAP
jgi:hypothetical protein